MKTNLYLCFIVLLALCSCKKKVLENHITSEESKIKITSSKNDVSHNQGKDNSINQNKKEVMYSIKLDDKFEKFDINWLHENATEKIIMGNDYNYEYDVRKDTVTYLISGNTVGGYNFVEIFKDNYFALSKEYYSSGNIKSKGILLNTLSLIDEYKFGVWYYFSDNGQLSETIDYDKPFTFTFDDILSFCRKENIKLEKGDIPYYNSGFHTNIRRIFSESTGECKWIILHEKTSITDLEEIVLDGKTGKVISRTKKAIEGP